MAVCRQLLSSHQFPPLSHRHTPAQKYEVQVGAGIWHINTFLSLFARVSTPLQAQEHLSSKSLQTTGVLNLIKDIADNRRPIKQASFQRSTGGAYIPTARRVTAHGLTTQQFFKVISLLCVRPPPPIPVNQVTPAVWKQFIQTEMSTLNKDCECVG